MRMKGRSEMNSVTLELHTFVELFVKQSGTNIDHTKRLST